jgi:hypothetical protein
MAKGSGNTSVVDPKLFFPPESHFPPSFGSGSYFTMKVSDPSLNINSFTLSPILKVFT